MQNSMVILTFSVLDQKYRFQANLSKKSELSLSGEIWDLDYQSEYAEFIGDTNFFCFQLVTLFLGKFVPKNQNCVFKLKFGSLTNLNMQNSVEMLTSLFQTGNTLFGQIWCKKLKLSFKAEIWYLD